MNTWFQHHHRHLYTWKSPGDGVRNHIDYITMNKRFRNAITQVTGYPGADCGSDHVPIVATMKVKLRTLKRKKADAARFTGSIQLMSTAENIVRRSRNAWQVEYRSTIPTFPGDTETQVLPEKREQTDRNG